MEKVKDFNRAFRTMRLITLLSFFGFITATVMYLLMYQHLSSEKENRVFVATNSGTFMAKAGDERQISPFEAKYISQVFIENMFGHDAETYAPHTNKALHLVDQPSGLMITKAFEDGNVQNEYIRWGSRTTIEVDSIKILSNSLPYQMQAYFRQQHWIGAEKKTELAIALKYDLIRTHRSEQNPFGMLLTKVDFIPYKTDPLN